MKPQKTPQQAADKWASRMQSGDTAQAYLKGAQAFGGNPMALAAAPDAQAKYLANTAAAVNSGRMAAALNAVPAGDWLKGIQTTGQGRLATGAANKKSKALRAYTRLQPIWANMRAASQAIAGHGKEAAKMKAAAALDVLMSSTGRT